MSQIKHASPLAAAICAEVERQQDELFSFLAGYVQQRSVNPRLTAQPDDHRAVQTCQLWLAERLQEFGCFDEVNKIEAQPGLINLAAVRRGRGTGRGVFFNGHSDVVPVTAEQQAAWREGDPWSGRRAEGAIWGRGTSDMKGGNATFIWAIKILHDLGLQLQGDAWATLVVGEETGDRQIGVGALMDGCTLPKAGIILEGTDLHVAPATMGEFYFKIVVQGQSYTLGVRHEAIYPTAWEHPSPGANAIDLMLKIAGRLQELERQWGLYRKHPLMPPGNMSINLSQIHGGNTYSAAADSCELVGSVLYAPDLSFEEVAAEFRAAIEQVVAGDYWLQSHRPEITIPHFIAAKPANNLPVDHPLSTSLGRALQTATGRQAIYSCPSSATNDGNYMVERGYETVTFGTHGYGIHGTNEHVRCDDLLDVTKTLALFLADWCGIKQPTP